METKQGSVEQAPLKDRLLGEKYSYQQIMLHSSLTVSSPRESQLTSRPLKSLIKSNVVGDAERTTKEQN